MTDQPSLGDIASEYFAARTAYATARAARATALRRFYAARDAYIAALTRKPKMGTKP